MIVTIERRNFHIFNKDTGVVTFPNRFEIRSEDNAKNFLGIYTAKRNGKWFLGLNISQTSKEGINRTIFAPCSFKFPDSPSEKAAFAGQMEAFRETGIRFPKSWWKEMDKYLASLHDR